MVPSKEAAEAVASIWAEADFSTPKGYIAGADGTAYSGSSRPADCVNVYKVDPAKSGRRM
jgi:hypothetical protein